MVEPEGQGTVGPLLGKEEGLRAVGMPSQHKPCWSRAAVMYAEHL